MDELELAEEIERVAEQERRTGDGCIWVTLPVAMTTRETEVANESLRRQGLQSCFAPPVVDVSFSPASGEMGG